jgi:hypothetical protein
MVARTRTAHSAVGVGLGVGLAFAVALGLTVGLGVGLGLAGVVHADRRSATARSPIFLFGFPLIHFIFGSLIVLILIFVYVVRYTKLLC